MSWITENLLQSIVYWANPVPDGYGGYTYDAPVEIFGRWEESQELFINKEGVEQRSKAKIFLAQDVDEEEYLYLGELIDIASGSSPQDVEGAYEIRAFKKIPNLDVTDYERKCWL